MNVPEALVNCEWRIGILEHIVDRLIAKAPFGWFTAKELVDWRREALVEPRRKYPSAGLVYEVSAANGAQKDV